MGMEKMMNRIRIWLLASLLILGMGSGELGAYPAGGLSFTLTEAQNYALQHSYTAQGAALDVDVAKKEVWKTIAGGLPQVNGTINYQHNFEVQSNVIDFGGQKQVIKFGTPYNTSVGISVNQKIFDGSYFIGVGASRVYLDLAKGQRKKTDVEVRSAVANAYYLVLAAEENERILKANLEANGVLLKETKAYYENGFREESDVQQMELLVRQAENRLAEAKRQVVSSRAVLKFAMGIDISRTILLKDDLDVHAGRVLNKGTGKNLWHVGNHVDFQLSSLNTRAQELLLKNEKASYLPRLSLFYNWNASAMTETSNVLSGDTDWFTSSAVGLSLNIPIFSSSKRMASVAQAKVNVKKAMVQQTMTRQNLEKNYRVAVSGFATSKEKYHSSKRALELAEDIYRKAIVKFDNGIASSTELNQLQDQYLQSSSGLIAATLDLLAQFLELETFFEK
jgi:outer membrane protein TolC